MRKKVILQILQENVWVYHLVSPDI